MDSCRTNVENSEVTSNPWEASLSSSAISRHPGARCHTLRVRVTEPDLLSDLSRNVEQVLFNGGVAAVSANQIQPSLWTEEVSFVSSSDKAEMLIHREMRRPIASGLSLLRVILIRYADASADLILVAARSIWSHAALVSIARSCLLGSVEPMPGAAEITADVGGKGGTEVVEYGDCSPTPEWGGGGRRKAMGAMSRHFAGSPDGHFAAACLARVLSGFYGKSTPSIAVLDDGGDGNAPWAGGERGFKLVALPVTSEQTAEGLASALRERILPNAPWYTDALIAELTERIEGDGEVTIGIAIVSAAHLKQAGATSVEYLPFLTASFPLTIAIEECADNGISVRCLFDEEIYAESAVNQLLDSWENVFTQSVSRTQEALSDIELLSELQRQKLVELGKSNNTLADVTERMETIVAQHAAKQGDAVALVYEEQSLSYGVLHGQANRMANALIELGVRRGDNVGICLERSLDLVVAMLAVLKAGATYVPVDPNYPQDRIAYVCGDAAMKILVNDGGEVEGVEQARILHVDRWQEAAKHCSEETPEITGVSADDPAYMIYTSGSTGRPKGVVIPHRNAVSLVGATKREFDLSPDDVWTLFHSSAFDFSVWEIWGCLLTGARLVVVPYWVSRQPDEFVELLNRHRVSVLNQTPSAFSQLIDADGKMPIESHLRLVIFGGEPLDTRRLLVWFDRHPESICRLVNMFGITETTVHVTMETITREHAITGSKSVGKPIPGWHLYVMDERQRLLPPGVPGEIYVGGNGVASHYHNRPDQTDQRFLTDYSGSGRMYRSGDKGILLENGDLQHKGRLDNQVKLRGFRIELDEIRSVLMTLPGVKYASVLLQQSDSEDPASARLDAYVVLEDIALDDVRSHAKMVLPEYMLPSTLSQVSEMPLTANGKLDTRKLEEYVIPEEVIKPKPATSMQVSEDPIECAMMAIWEQVLGRKVSAGDNFFDLGGNSLYAIRLAAEMTQAGLPPIHMRDLYVHQNIKNLVKIVREMNGATLVAG